MGTKTVLDLDEIVADLQDWVDAKCNWEQRTRGAIWGEYVEPMLEKARKKHLRRGREPID